MKQITVYTFEYYSYDPFFDEDIFKRISEIETQTYSEDSPVFKNFVEPNLDRWTVHAGIYTDTETFRSLSLETAQAERNKWLKKLSQ